MWKANAQVVYKIKEGHRYYTNSWWEFNTPNLSEANRVYNDSLKTPGVYAVELTALVELEPGEDELQYTRTDEIKLKTWTC